MLTESQEAILLVKWLRLIGVKHHHSPNETGGTAEARRRATRVKREGVSKGYPDYTIFINQEQSKDGESYVIFLELKRVKKSYPSKEQKEWIEFISKMDMDHCHAYIGKGFEHSKQIISHYLREQPTPLLF